MYRYSYDGAGNLVQVENDSQTQVLKSYTYTPAGLLATATYKDKDGNDRTFVNTWDANSNRVSFNANGTEYELVYDPTASIPAVIEESTSGSTTYYIRDPGGSLIARLSATDGIRYYHFDELGSTGLLTDADGNITNRYTYDAYGSLLSHDRYAGSVNQPYQYVGSLGYYTHWMEPDFGLLQLGVRFYDPEVGRFTQRDPIWAAQESRYCYSGQCPLRLNDPSGLLPSDVYDAVDAAWDIISAALGLSIAQIRTPACSICLGGYILRVAYFTSDCMVNGGKFLQCLKKAFPKAYNNINKNRNGLAVGLMNWCIDKSCTTCLGAGFSSIGKRLSYISKHWDDIIESLRRGGVWPL